MATLDDLLDQLEPDALRVVEYIAKRLLVGQKTYGMLDLAKDTRDWEAERAAEIGDLLVYSAMIELKRAVK